MVRDIFNSKTFLSIVKVRKERKVLGGRKINSKVNQGTGFYMIALPS